VAAVETTPEGNKATKIGTLGIVFGFWPHLRHCGHWYTDRYMHGIGGTVVRSSFDETKEEALQAALAALRRQLPKPEADLLALAGHAIQ
jgi:hypothetical protein